MAEAGIRALPGKRILVVEDEYIIAADLVHLLEDVGAEVVGPVGTVDAGLELVREHCGRLDGAVLDVNLRDLRVYPVAEALAAGGVPFVFATGYDPDDMPAAYAARPRCGKPIDRAELINTLASLVSP